MVNDEYLGIDIGGTSIKIGLFTGEGKKLKSNNYEVAFDNYKTPILVTVKNSCKSFVESNKIDIKRLRGIGVSTTGAIDSVEGVVKGAAGHIDNWVGSEIKKEIGEMFGTPVEVLNDANAAALGEMWKGAAKGKKNVVVITVGTGVGGGIIVNSQILLGANGYAGEIGHMPIDVNGQTCSCGNRGCIEKYGSTKALIGMVNEQIECGNLTGPTDGKVDGKWIFSQVADDNDIIKGIVDEWINYLASFMVGLVHIFNPQMILVGGGISAQEEFFIRPLCQKIREKAMPHFVEKLEIKKAELGNDAGMIGAVFYCIQNNVAKPGSYFE